ncbi:MAG: HDOD domain-containing protein [Pseudomonadales bacterium]|jgi:HD-like signal output (HDOD) protein/prolyl-tRNA editing enzyme YbaK/EbsC (Cys-tRNA(Pro) deacylase)|nr:HDOD domain-containing protein [Pseudomonadales bacterium]
MQLPEAVSNVLDAGGIAWSPVELAATPAQAEVHPVVLQDAAGRLLALVAADSLLDLDALNRCTGRELIATPAEAVTPLFAAHGLHSLPSVPQVLDLPVIVDQRLLASSELSLDAGAGGAQLQMSGAAFRALLEPDGCTVADFCVALDDIPPAASANADVAEIGNAVARFTARRIARRLEDTLDFPPLPEIAHRIIRISADPYASVSDLARVVEIDPSLSAQVVSWASSPYYAAPGKVKSIQDAIVRVLGFDLVMNLALGLALGKTMRLPKEGRYGYRNYWLQAVHGAAMVEGLCKAMPSSLRPGLGHAYLSGLLHNFGFLILAELFKPQLQLVCRYAEANPHLGHWHVERFLLGVTREQMAGWLMRFWHLPEEVCAALRFQQTPEQAGEHEVLARVLHLATRLLREQGIGSAPLQPIADAAFAELGISRSDALAVSERIHGSAEELQAIARDLAA